MVKCYRLMGIEHLANDVLRVLEMNHPNHKALKELKSGNQPKPESTEH